MAGPTEETVGGPPRLPQSVASGALAPLGAGPVLVSGFTFTASSPCFVFFPDSGHSFSNFFFLKNILAFLPHLSPLLPLPFSQHSRGVQGSEEARLELSALAGLWCPAVGAAGEEPQAGRCRASAGRVYC